MKKQLLYLGIAAAAYFFLFHKTGADAGSTAPELTDPNEPPRDLVLTPVTGTPDEKRAALKAAKTGTPEQKAAFAQIVDRMTSAEVDTLHKYVVRYMGKPLATPITLRGLVQGIATKYAFTLPL